MGMGCSTRNVFLRFMLGLSVSLTDREIEIGHFSNISRIEGKSNSTAKKTEEKDNEDNRILSLHIICSEWQQLQENHNHRARTRKKHSASNKPLKMLHTCGTTSSSRRTMQVLKAWKKTACTKG